MFIFISYIRHNSVLTYIILAPFIYSNITKICFIYDQPCMQMGLMPLQYEMNMQALHSRFIMQVQYMTSAIPTCFKQTFSVWEENADDERDRQKHRMKVLQKKKSYIYIYISVTWQFQQCHFNIDGVGLNVKYPRSVAGSVT